MHGIRASIKYRRRAARRRKPAPNAADRGFRKALTAADEGRTLFAPARRSPRMPKRDQAALDRITKPFREVGSSHTPGNRNN